MDEMNNVTMENETSMMENAPVENLVPAEAEGYTSDCGCESNANLDLGKIVKIGVGAVLLIGAGVKYGIPAAKKGFKHIKEKMASKKAKKDEVIDVESTDVTSDEETCEGKLYDDCMEKLNRTLDGPYGIPIDIIVGTFLIVGLTEDDFGELLPEFVEKYEKMFHQPRKFVTYTDSEGKVHLDVDYCTPEE